jgi:hypothetical protein
MPDQPDEPDDDASEIVSPLVHELTEEPGDGPVARIVVEKRGIREAEWVHFDNPMVQDPAVEDAPADTHALLFMAANRHLRAVGQMDFFAVADTAERIAPAGEYPSPARISQHFAMWADGLKNEKGVLSIDAIAARFIQAQDRLMMLLNGDPEMQAAAFAYADAWHWLHLELFGEHELAAKGVAARRGLNAGPEAKRNQGALRTAIVELAYNKFAADEKNEANRNSAKYAADTIFQSVNKDLGDRKMEPIAIGTIRNQLGAIIKRSRDRK